MERPGVRLPRRGELEVPGRPARPRRRDVARLRRIGQSDAAHHGLCGQGGVLTVDAFVPGRASTKGLG